MGWACEIKDSFSLQGTYIAAQHFGKHPLMTICLDFKNKLEAVVVASALNYM